MTRLALIGYGQMGKLIEEQAGEFDCEVVIRIDPKLKNFLTSEIIAKCDICVDFSYPEAVLDNIKTYAATRKNCVIGTTGWQDNFDEIVSLVESSGIGMVYADNFSLGMNMFYKIVDYATKIMNKFKNYDVYGYELHHRLKLDSPSGTARKLSEIVIRNTEGKVEAYYDRLNRRIKPEEFHFASIRAGNIPGVHHLGFDSTADTIDLIHTARNREGFVAGALSAARMIKNRQGMFTFSDLLEKELE